MNRAQIWFALVAEQYGFISGSLTAVVPLPAGNDVFVAFYITKKKPILSSFLLLFLLSTHAHHIHMRLARMIRQKLRLFSIRFLVKSLPTYRFSRIFFSLICENRLEISTVLGESKRKQMPFNFQ